MKKLKAVSQCIDQTGNVAQEGAEFYMESEAADSLIAIGAAIALPPEPVNEEATQLSEEAIAPPPKKPKT